MEPSLKIADLHEAYRSASPADAIAMANLGAICWSASRGELFSQWETAMSADETEKADVWRKEGAATMLESVKMRLAQADTLSIRLATAEASVTQLLADAEAEAAKRAEALVAAARQGFELQKMTELSELRERLAELSARDALIGHLETNVSLLTERLEARDKQIADLTVATTKSSHAIGKAGEATIWEMLESTVLPEFTHAEARNMTGVSHAADFHLKVLLANGSRVKILIDSKKYKRAVNSEEIAKLVADVDSDPEAQAGLMVSLVSPICTMKQFQIKETDKGKPILYLSFVDIEKDQQAAILCWAIRALMSAVHESREEVSIDIERTEELLNEICGELKNVDNMVKTHQKMIDTLRSMKNTILDKIGDYRGKPAGETDVISHVTEGCITVLKATGLPCGKTVVGDGQKCRHHTSRRGKVES
jgi:hypothetical protein